MTSFALAIHGGAGTITRENMTPQKERMYRLALHEALQAGHSVLKKGGSALDAVEASVRSMEDCPLFNAGKGSVFTHDGTIEMDASIMCGKTLGAGSVAGVRNIRNPISAARTVMEKSNHVMLIGEGAQKFAQLHGLQMEDESYFRTEDRYRQLQRALAADRGEVLLDHDAAARLAAESTKEVQEPVDATDKKFGTVGAVCVDSYGNLAAATSTGGMTNKQFGRVGDSPIVGAGTYADNQAGCAVSATGHGEYFIRAAVAHDICCRMNYKGLTLQQAANEVIHGRLVELGGSGGVVCVDRTGQVHLPFNSAGMYRGWIREDGISYIGVYKDAEVPFGEDGEHSVWTAEKLQL